ncbi:hypothetical protein BJV82DRAFT_676395 [Fennellomyces sp. T-0311]|nr:hypothetical protein BJV82DRAFT_676395 [Fennellomyces sp. T-0311]
MDLARNCCPFKSCYEPIPAFGSARAFTRNNAFDIPQSSEDQTRNLQIENDNFDSDPCDFSFDNDEMEDDNEDEISQEYNNVGLIPELRVYREEPVGEPAIPDKGMPRSSRNMLSENKFNIAQLAVDANISKRHYTRLHEIVETAVKKSLETGMPVSNRFSTWDGIQNHLRKNGESSVLLPFKTEIIDLADVDDFPHKYAEKFSAVMGQITLVYRDISALSQRLFSHPLFEDMCTALNGGTGCT